MEVFNPKKLIRSKSGLRIVVTNEEFKSPFVVQEPLWVPDKEASNCSNCMAKFGFTTRKHHCRRCGQIFCSCCCQNKIELQRMCFVDPVRICVKCEPKTKEENMFFARHLKLLTNGAVFKIDDKTIPASYHLLHCKLSQDHRYLLFDGVKIPPVDINEITSVKIFKDTKSGLKSLDFSYAIGDEEKSVRLDIANGPQVEKVALNWIYAIEQAFELLNRAVEQRIS